MTIDGVVTRNEERTLLSKYPCRKELDELNLIFIDDQLKSSGMKIENYAEIGI